MVSVFLLICKDSVSQLINVHINIQQSWAPCQITMMGMMEYVLRYSKSTNNLPDLQGNLWSKYKLNTLLPTNPKQALRQKAGTKHSALFH